MPCPCRVQVGRVAMSAVQSPNPPQDPGRGHVMDAPELWKRYWQYLCHVDSLDLTLDISRMHFEERMVGHYWLRAPQTADQIAAIVAAQSAETIYLILEHLSSNGRAKMARSADPGVQMFSRI